MSETAAAEFNHNMIKDDSCTAAKAPDWQEEWVGTSFRMWAAHEGSIQEEILAYLLPVEIDFIINLHLLLLRDLGTFDPVKMIDSEIEIRAYAIARLQGFIESGFISVEKMNILSRLMVHEDLFPSEGESALYLSDLNFDLEA